MKVCVTAMGPGLDAEVDPRFGRAQYFVFVDTESMKHESVQNPNVSGFGGVGIQSAQLVVDKGAQVVITGHVGPNAAQALSAAGVKVITGAQGMRVKDAVERFISGAFSETDVQISASEASPSMDSIKREIETLKNRLSELERKLRELENK